MESFRQTPQMAPRFQFHDGMVDVAFVDQVGKQVCLSISIRAFCDLWGSGGRVMQDIRTWMLNADLERERTIQVP
jgi:hypothetical protein